jgi:hypothetical protein
LIARRGGVSQGVMTATMQELGALEWVDFEEHQHPPSDP